MRDVRHRGVWGCILGMGAAGLLAVPGRAATVDYIENTEPAGLFSSTESKETPVSITTRMAPLEIYPYSFAYWTLDDGMTSNRMEDAMGRALNPFAFTLVSASRATAHYVDTTNDVDADGIPDWYELQLYGLLTNTAVSDSDGDGFDLMTEYTRDWNPRMSNSVTEGGISRRRSRLQMFFVDTNYFYYTRSSVPAGIQNSSEIVTNGAVLILPELYGAKSGSYQFGQWYLNGQRVADDLGRSLGLSFTVTGAMAAVAYYYLEDADDDADGILDWYEWHFFGSLTNTALSDTDSDGLDLLTEYTRDTHPGISNRYDEGGVSRRRSLTTGFYGPPYVLYTLNSSPAGIFSSSSSYITSGTQVATTFLHGESTGYNTFGYWTVNGVRQQDNLGMALSQATFVLTTGTTATAHYFPTADDTDVDGFPDWYEYWMFGNLSQSGASDSDGDGFDLLTEYTRDWCPALSNTVTEGGISRRRSRGTTMNLQVFDRPVSVNVEGSFTNFFTPWPTNVTGKVFGANTAPALGDWDGDNDLDLWVGASGGVMRVYENSGSPTVFNLRDRTTNFGALASAWAGLPNPAPALGDWNGDGRADLAVGGETNGIRLVAFSGGIQSPAVVATDIVFTVSLPAGAATNVVPAFTPVAAANGRADLLVLLGDGSVTLYTNTGNAAAPYSEAQAHSNLLGAAVTAATGISAADVNEDGLWDVLVSDSAGQISEYYQQGNGTFVLMSRVFAGSYPDLANRLTIAVADVDGDGDPDVVGGFAEGGLIYLQNPRLNLMLSPPLASLMPGQGKTFSALNAQGGVAWSFLWNRSGGNLHAVSGAYTAGTNAPGMDVIQAADGAGKKGRAYVNVLNPSVTNSTDKVVILAGRKAETDPLWPATDYLADYAFNILRYRGYPGEHIQYLSPVTNQDVDGDGVSNDVDLATTWTNTQATFTNFVKGSGTLFVYLVDHGGTSAGKGYFTLSPGETLSATNLDAWLDDLQDTYDTEVTILLDFCEAGAFAADLTYTGTARRTVMAACSAGQSSYFVSGGLVSFSDAFFSGVLMGLDVLDCYTLAAETVSSYQTAILSGVAAGVEFGVEGVVGQAVPQIGSVCGNLTLNGEGNAVLWAGDIFSAYDLEKVWCVVVPPGHVSDGSDPVIDLPEVELVAGNGRYEAEVGGFSGAGIYKVLYYARDIWGGVSLPKSGYVNQSAYDEKVVLVACGLTNNAEWADINALANLAYHTFEARWLGPEKIQYLSCQSPQDVDEDGTNDVDALPTLESLGNAITNWARGADKLTVYFIGEGTNGTVRLNETEYLSASNLDLWVDVFQQSNADACVVMDFDGSGGFLPTLLSPASASRVTVAGGLTENVHGNKGLVSFSQFFLSDVFSGYSVGDAYSHARSAILTASGLKVKQSALLDDNRDGLSNASDGQTARQWYIGSAFITGDETPVLAEVTPDTWLKGTGSALLWVSGVTDMQGVSNVWCLVTAPDFDGLGDLVQTNLAWNAATARYEALYTNFSRMGTYACTFLAMDNNGEVSSPLQCEVLVTDAYESDDDATQAVAFTVEQAQGHDFHAAEDEDWAKFYFISNQACEIVATQTGTNVDAVLEVYYERADGSLSNVWTVNAEARGPTNEQCALGADASGFYYVRVRPADTNSWGTDSEYALQVRHTAGGTNRLRVVGVNGLTAGALPSGIRAHLDAGAEIEFAGGTWVEFATNGTHTVTLAGVPAGWDYAGYAASQEVAVPVDGFGYAAFVLVPMIRVEGVVRDGWTGERLSGAALNLTATSGRIAGQSAATNWASEADGSFPTNVRVATENWDLLISKAGYSNLVLGVAGAALTAGAVTNVGQPGLTPLDANTNGMADSWEASAFGAVTNASPSGDADGDGLSNREEYWVGTDPMSGSSVLKVEDVDKEGATNGVTLRWAVVNGRSYRVVATNALGAGEWPVEGGPWTAAAGQTNMTWTDTNAASGAKFYRMEVVVP